MGWNKITLARRDMWLLIESFLDKEANRLRLGGPGVADIRPGKDGETPLSRKIMNIKRELKELVDMLSNMTATEKVKIG